jgi:hypothetical protein
MNLYRGKTQIKIMTISAKAFAIFALFLMPTFSYAVTQSEIDAKNQELQQAKEV